MNSISEAEKEALKNYLNRYVVFDENEFEIFLDHLEKVTIEKKKFLLEPDQVCRAQYFILSGCLRTFYFNEKGIEQTLLFAIENWWITEHDSFVNEKPSQHYIQALEDAELLKLDKAKMEALYLKVPKVERLFRIIAEKTLIASLNRLQLIFNLSREEMLGNFNNATGPFAQRVPQKMLASYLGFTPEFFSMIKAKKKKKGE